MGCFTFSLLEATAGFEPAHRGFADLASGRIGVAVSTPTVLDGTARCCAVPQMCVQFAVCRYGPPLPDDAA